MVLPPFTTGPIVGLTTEDSNPVACCMLYVVTRPSGSVTVVVVSSDSFEVYCRVRGTVRCNPAVRVGLPMSACSCVMALGSFSPQYTAAVIEAQVSPDFTV